MEFSSTEDLAKSHFSGNLFTIVSGGKLYLVDTMGQVTSQYAAPSGWVYAMAYGHGSPWYVPHSYSDSVGVYRIDSDSTAIIGSVVSRKLFSIPMRSVDAMTTDSSGFIIANEDLLFRFSLHGELRDILESPVSRISGLAWDGESLWVLHHGPKEAPTDATLLSRFKFE